MKYFLLFIKLFYLEVVWLQSVFPCVREVMMWGVASIVVCPTHYILIGPAAPWLHFSPHSCAPKLLLWHVFCLLLQITSLHAYLVFNLVLTSFPLPLYFYLTVYHGCQMMDWTQVVPCLPYVPSPYRRFKGMTINLKSQKQTNKHTHTTHTHTKHKKEAHWFLRSPKQLKENWRRKWLLRVPEGDDYCKEAESSPRMGHTCRCLWLLGAEKAQRPTLQYFVGCTITGVTNISILAHQFLPCHGPGSSCGGSRSREC